MRATEFTIESIGDKRTDPASSSEFVSNKYLVKFTPTEILFYKGGELVYKKPGNYSKPNRNDVYVAKGITTKLWEKDKIGLIPNLGYSDAVEKLTNQKRELDDLIRKAPYGSPEYRKYKKQYAVSADQLKNLKNTQGEWKKKPLLTTTVSEVFQSGKQNWEWLRRGSEEANAQFKVGDREYRWDAFTQRANPKKWEIQFRLIRNLDDDPDLNLFGKTGTGNSAEVLATAVDIIRSFLQEYGLDKVEEITFNAKEDSRIGLYAKMIQRLLPGWDLYSRKDSENGMQFTLTDRRAYDKPENKLNEIGNTFYDVEKTSSSSPSKNIQIKHAKGVAPFTPKTRANFKFKTDSGTEYVINLSMMKSPKNGRTGVEVVFYDNNESRNDNIGITNKGDAVKVFSTVKAVLTKFLSEHPKASVVAFSAKTDEPSRVKLYQTFANQFTRWFPKFSEQKVYRHPDYTTYAMMIPKNETVEEEIIDEMPLPTDWDPSQMRQQATTFKSRLAYALERAKKLGTGSSRVATIIEYQGRPTVLKIAKNAKGLAQNSVEADILSDGYASQLGILIPIIDYDEQNREPSWVHTEMATKANEGKLCSLMKCDSLSQLVRFANTIAGKYRGQTSQDFINNLVNDGKNENDIETMTDYANVLADLANSFDVELADFNRAANWGIYNGKPVIVDVGFNSNVMNQYYK